MRGLQGRDMTYPVERVKGSNVGPRSRGNKVRRHYNGYQRHSAILLLVLHYEIFVAVDIYLLPICHDERRRRKVIWVSDHDDDDDGKGGSIIIWLTCILWQWLDRLIANRIMWLLMPRIGILLDLSSASKRITAHRKEGRKSDVCYIGETTILVPYLKC